MESFALTVLAADAILLLHVLFVGFVLVGLALIIVGKVRSWSWVRHPWFRLAHLVAIGVVIMQSWLDVICPLTTLENALRLRAGGVEYSNSFISHWLEAILYYQAPAWVFVVCYTAFGVLAVACWFFVPPRSFTKLG
ncbi:MAG: DUF2784 domain-containing protein [Deltaproteobacteria bacterium]|jgi:hypothetical protein|nr:DUF2784 domain-containing protein [Deltaproteobacteria bacterium]MCW8891826.1 DUF2784 domain-containing protein [Deltaproteobacteria bacterium]MCW9049246.1 DUF2784 domain-containing protein [Deltaproteobacteria bacterium]